MESQIVQSNLLIYPDSLTVSADCEYGLVQAQTGRALVILAKPGSTVLSGFEGETSEFGEKILLHCPLTALNAAALRTNLTWLKPGLLGLHTSFGMGDRLGIATAGHVRAVRSAKTGILPIFAQQSIREMQRTGRSPQQVMDDATWGIFESGWHEGSGADADHLKTTTDIDACLLAGFTFYTFDPSEHVDNHVESMSLDRLRENASTLPIALQPHATGLLGRTLDIEGHKLYVHEHNLLKAAVKYGRALAQVKIMAEHLERTASQGQIYEIEVSMDETELPTTPVEHVYMASTMKRLGINWVSFAPRFVGRFEKGVDYIGDVREFAETLAVHAAIARQFGPYKLSLHSGSDKFSIYPIFMEKTNGLAHVKTAGTSYLEALRTIATVDEDFVKEIYSFAMVKYETDKRSYHVSAQVSKLPDPTKLSDAPGVLDQFDAREILHVTFGSVLTEKAAGGGWRFYDRLMDLLQVHREMYFDLLAQHFNRHLAPFSLTRLN
jgi:tagaturonate epimerase